MEKTASNPLLLIGDVVVLGVVTLAGFASHDTLDTAGTRLWVTFVSLGVAWVVLAFFGGLFTPARVWDARQLWRPFVGMILAAPFAGWMRALWLGRGVEPVFVMVLGGVSALAILAWRAVYLALYKRKMRLSAVSHE